MNKALSLAVLSACALNASARVLAPSAAPNSVGFPLGARAALPAPLAAQAAAPALHAAAPALSAIAEASAPEARAAEFARLSDNSPAAAASSAGPVAAPSETEPRALSRTAVGLAAAGGLAASASPAWTYGDIYGGAVAASPIQGTVETATAFPEPVIAFAAVFAAIAAAILAAAWRARRRRIENDGHWVPVGRFGSRWVPHHPAGRAKLWDGSNAIE